MGTVDELKPYIDLRNKEKNSMLLTLILLIPSVLSLALCTYMLAGLFIYLRNLYQTAPAGELARTARMASTPSAPSMEIEAIPAT